MNMKFLLIELFFISALNRPRKGPKRNLYTRRKLALVIGNENYERSENKIQNSINHAGQLADLLKSMSFNVMLRKDVKFESAIMRSVQELNDTCTIEDGDLILFYFSGHAYQFQGKNYLIPTYDSEIVNEEDITYFGIDVARILGRFREEKPKCAIIFLLDCCRSYKLKQEPSETGK